jgi:hypothetical protein
MTEPYQTWRAPREVSCPELCEVTDARLVVFSRRAITQGNDLFADGLWRTLEFAGSLSRNMDSPVEHSQSIGEIRYIHQSITKNDQTSPNAIISQEIAAEIAAPVH